MSRATGRAGPECQTHLLKSALISGETVPGFLHLLWLLFAFVGSSLPTLNAGVLAGPSRLSLLTSKKDAYIHTAF